jgi:hypothetical protein
MAKKVKRVAPRNVAAVAMRKRFPRKQVMAHRANKRAKDAKNSWRRDWD